MQKKPKIFSLIAWGLLFVAWSMPAQIALIYGHGFSEFSSVLYKLSKLNWLVILGAMICAILVNRVSRWTLYAFPLWLLAAGINNWAVGYYGTDFTLMQAGLATLSLILLLTPIYRQKYLVCFSRPQVCWWKTPQRKRLNLQLTLTNARKTAFLAQTFDLSETGLFIACDKDLLADDDIQMDLSLKSDDSIRCNARVARRTDKLGIYPQGIGVEFLNLKSNDKRRLRQWLNTAEI